jgi:hypothetical protein
MPRCGPTERPQFQVACAGGLPDSSPCMQRCNNIDPLARRRMQYSAGRRVWPARGSRGLDGSSSRRYCLLDHHDHDRRWRWRLSRSTTWTRWPMSRWHDADVRQLCPLSIHRTWTYPIAIRGAPQRRADELDAPSLSGHAPAGWSKQMNLRSWFCYYNRVRQSPSPLLLAALTELGALLATGL